MRISLLKYIIGLIVLLGLFCQKGVAQQGNTFVTRYGDVQFVLTYQDSVIFARSDKLQAILHPNKASLYIGMPWETLTISHDTVKAFFQYLQPGNLEFKGTLDDQYLNTLPREPKQFFIQGDLSINHERQFKEIRANLVPQKNSHQVAYKLFMSFDINLGDYNVPYQKWNIDSFAHVRMEQVILKGAND